MFKSKQNKIAYRLVMITLLTQSRFFLTYPSSSFLDVDRYKCSYKGGQSCIFRQPSYLPSQWPHPWQMLVEAQNILSGPSQPGQQTSHLQAIVRRGLNKCSCTSSASQLCWSQNMNGKSIYFPSRAVPLWHNKNSPLALPELASEYHLWKREN